MADRYGIRPSEMLGINYDLLAFMVDEFSMYLEVELTNKEGEIEWGKLYTTDKKRPITPKVNELPPNQAMMNHIEQHDRGANVTVK